MAPPSTPRRERTPSRVTAAPPYNNENRTNGTSTKPDHRGTIELPRSLSRSPLAPHHSTNKKSGGVTNKPSNNDGGGTGKENGTPPTPNPSNGPTPATPARPHQVQQSLKPPSNKEETGTNSGNENSQPGNRPPDIQPRSTSFDIQSPLPVLQPGTITTLEEQFRSHHVRQRRVALLLLKKALAPVAVHRRLVCRGSAPQNPFSKHHLAPVSPIRATPRRRYSQHKGRSIRKFTRISNNHVRNFLPRFVFMWGKDGNRRKLRLMVPHGSDNARNFYAVYTRNPKVAVQTTENQEPKHHEDTTDRTSPRIDDTPPSDEDDIGVGLPPPPPPPNDDASIDETDRSLVVSSRGNLKPPPPPGGVAGKPSSSVATAAVNQRRDTKSAGQRSNAIMKLDKKGERRKVRSFESLKSAYQIVQVHGELTTIAVEECFKIVHDHTEMTKVANEHLRDCLDLKPDRNDADLTNEAQQVDAKKTTFTALKAFPALELPPAAKSSQIIKSPPAATSVSDVSSGETSVVATDKTTNDGSEEVSILISSSNASSDETRNDAPQAELNSGSNNDQKSGEPSATSSNEISTWLKQSLIVAHLSHIIPALEAAKIFEPNDLVKVDPSRFDSLGVTQADEKSKLSVVITLCGMSFGTAKQSDEGDQSFHNRHGDDEATTGSKSIQIPRTDTAARQVPTTSTEASVHLDITEHREDSRDQDEGTRERVDFTNERSTIVIQPTTVPGFSEDGSTLGNIPFANAHDSDSGHNNLSENHFFDDGGEVTSPVRAANYEGNCVSMEQRESTAAVVANHENRQPPVRAHVPPAATVPQVHGQHPPFWANNFGLCREVLDYMRENNIALPTVDVASGTVFYDFRRRKQFAFHLFLAEKDPNNRRFLKWVDIRHEGRLVKAIQFIRFEQFYTHVLCANPDNPKSEKDHRAFMKSNGLLGIRGEDALYHDRGWFHPDRPELLPMIYDEKRTARNAGRAARNYWQDILNSGRGLNNGGFSGNSADPLPPAKADQNDLKNAM